MSSSYEEVKGTHVRDANEAMRSREEAEYGDMNPRTSSFEADDDFKFKRHKNKQRNGVPSLGERLDNLQDIKKARWVDNFNSSMPNGREAIPNGDSSPRIRTQEQSQPYSQGAQVSGGLAGAPYMPYMYYYPMPTQGPPMVPYVGSPVHTVQMESGQYMNSSMVPNTSLQPFFPPPPPQPRYENGVSQLLPPANFYPYGMVQSQQQYAQKSRERRKSIALNRGRRLSLLASQNDQHGIISPHKDVPERDFHRHIGDTSFGKGLQMRQLFNWCIIRALRNLEKKEAHGQQASGNSEDKYINPNKMALSILKEFVNDLRKGTIDIDWEAEECVSGDDEADGTGEDTELRELFEEDNETDKIHTEGEKSSVRRTRSTGARKEHPKIPNSKNAQNEKNLEALTLRIKNIKQEIESWAQVLTAQRPEAEWQALQYETRTPDESLKTEALKFSVDDPHDELSQRLDRLQIHSHLLGSSSQALSLLVEDRNDKLSQDFVSLVRHNKQDLDSKALLKGLSKSLAL